MGLLRLLSNWYNYKILANKNKSIKTKYSTDNKSIINPIYFYANNYNMYTGLPSSIFKEFATIGILFEYHTSTDNSLNMNKELLQFVELLNMVDIKYTILNTDESEDNDIFITGSIKQFSDVILYGFDYLFEEFSNNEFLKTLRNSLYNFEYRGFDDKIFEKNIMDKELFIYETMYNNQFRIKYDEIADDMFSNDKITIIEYDHFDKLSNGSTGVNFDLVQIMQLSSAIFISDEKCDIEYKARFKTPSNKFLYKTKSSDLFEYLGKNGDFIYDSYLDCSGFNCISDIDKIFGRKYISNTSNYDPYKNIDEIIS